MSGGHFNYEQTRFHYISEELDNLIQQTEQYNASTIAFFEETKKKLLECKQAVDTIDYIVSGDSSEQSEY